MALFPQHGSCTWCHTSSYYPEEATIFFGNYAGAKPASKSHIFKRQSDFIWQKNGKNYFFGTKMRSELSKICTLSVDFNFNIFAHQYEVLHYTDYQLFLE